MRYLRAVGEALAIAAAALGLITIAILAAAALVVTALR